MRTSEASTCQDLNLDKLCWNWWITCLVRNTRCFKIIRELKPWMRQPAKLEQLTWVYRCRSSFSSILSVGDDPPGLSELTISVCPYGESIRPLSLRTTFFGHLWWMPHTWAKGCRGLDLPSLRSGTWPCNVTSHLGSLNGHALGEEWKEGVWFWCSSWSPSVDGRREFLRWWRRWDEQRHLCEWHQSQVRETRVRQDVEVVKRMVSVGP